MAIGVIATGVGVIRPKFLNYSDVIPSCSERVFAAATASATAARRPPRSSSRSPAAVVPPGEVTIARNWAAVVSNAVSGALSRRSSSIAAEPAIVCDTRSVATPARQTRRDCRVDEGLDHQEEIRRTGSRYRGDGVELDLRHRQHPTHGVEDRRHLLEVLVVANRPRESALTPPPTTIGALGITLITGAPAGSLDS